MSAYSSFFKKNLFPGHLCSSSVSQHGQDCLHFRPGRLHPELQTGRLQEHQVRGVPDTAGRQRLLQLHHAVPPAVLEHVHWSRYTPVWTHTPHTTVDSDSFSVLPGVPVKSVHFRKLVSEHNIYDHSSVWWMQWDYYHVMAIMNEVVFAAKCMLLKIKMLNGETEYEQDPCIESICCHNGVVSSSCPGSGHS